MNCNDAKQRLSSAPTVATLKADQALQTHLESCADCRELARERELTETLAGLPVPPSSAGFADRALESAWASAHGTSQSTTWRPKTAMAASVLLAGVLGYQFYEPQGTQQLTGPTVVKVAPESIRPVHVRLVSRKALPEATITIQWDSQVALNGYSGTTTLRWKTAIAAGANELELPVKMTSGQRGDIEIQVTSGNARKTMRFTVEPELHTAATWVPSHYEYNI